MPTTAKGLIGCCLSILSSLLSLKAAKSAKMGFEDLIKGSASLVTDVILGQGDSEAAAHRSYYPGNAFLLLLHT
jgi:hypothetical protein